MPHYVSLTPSPRAAKALCDRLATLLEIPLDTAELEEASNAYIQQVSEAVAADEETAAYVDELESRAEEIDDETELPSGETLAAELTRFLREREQDGGEGSSAARRAVAATEREGVRLNARRERELQQRALRRLRAARSV